MQKRSVYVPPSLRKKCGSEISLQDIDADDEAQMRGKALTSVDIHKIYQDFQIVSHGDQKLNHSEFNGEPNDDVFIFDDTC